MRRMLLVIDVIDLVLQLSKTKFVEDEVEDGPGGPDEHEIEVSCTLMISIFYDLFV